MASAERLQGVSALLVELYEGKATEAKAGVSQQLSHLRAQPAAWEDALWWFRSTANLGGPPSAVGYVSYWCASALEEAVRVADEGQAGRECRLAIRAGIFAPETEHGEEDGSSVLVAAARGARPPLPKAVALRLRKVYVDVGKAAWPGELPRFLEEICGACVSADAATAALGLELLALLAEEFCGPSKLAARRQQALRDRVAVHLPEIIGLLCETLRRASAADFAASSSSSSSSSITEARDAALSALSTLVTHAPLATHLSSDLFTTLFAFVERDVRRAVVQGSQGGGGGGADNNYDAGTEALRTLDAVLAKKLVPPGFERFVLDLGAHVLAMLRSLAEALDAQAARANRDDAFDELVYASTELVATFVDQHLGRVAQTDAFPLSDLLSLVAKLTFAPQTNALGLRNLLRPWETLVAFLAGDGDGERSAHRTAMAHQNAQGIASILETLLIHRLLHAKNHEALEELDETVNSDRDGTPDDPGADSDVGVNDLLDDLAGGAPDERALGGGCSSSELAALFAEALDLIASACLANLDPCVSECVAVACVRELNPALERATSGDEQTAELGATDAATLLYALATSAAFCRSAEAVFVATDAALRAANGTLQARAHTRGACFAKLETAALDTLRTLVPSAVRAAISSPEEAARAAVIVDGALDAAACALDASIAPAPEPVARAAAWVVLSIAKSLSGESAARNSRLASLAAGGVHALALSMPQRCGALVYRAAAAVSLAPGAALRPDQADQAIRGLDVLLRPLVAPLVDARDRCATSSFDAEALDGRGLAQLQRNTRFLSALCAGYARDRTPQKALTTAFFANGNAGETALGAALHATPQVLAHCAAVALSSANFDRSTPPQVIRQFAARRTPHLSAATALVDLLVAASAAFGHAYGGQHALNAVGALLVAFDRSSPVAVLAQQRPGGASYTAAPPPQAAAVYLLKATCRLLAQVAHGTPAAVGASVPDVCELALRHVAPLAESPKLAAELIPPLLDLARTLLVSQWSAFAARALPRAGQPLPQKAAFRSDVSASHFRALMHLLLRACRGVDLPPTCVHAAITTLAAADQAQRLFDFEVFATNWLPAFADAVFDTLFDRRHDLLADDLATLLHALVHKDLGGFFDNFLPQKLVALQPLADSERHAVLNAWPRAADAPTFVAATQNAVADVAFYRDRRTTPANILA